MFFFTFFTAYVVGSRKAQEAVEIEEGPITPTNEYEPIQAVVSEGFIFLVIRLKKIFIGDLLYTFAGYCELKINCNPRLTKKQMKIGSMMTDI